jgi:very-short-patch-repair endonuclease
MSTGRARALRKKSTWAERRLWRLLRSRRLAGYKFRRQHQEGRYYLDFFCLEARVAVELDGSGHGFPGKQQYDIERDAFLAARGIIVKRVWNHQLAKAEGRLNLVDNLWRLLQERSPHPENIALPPVRREPDKPEIPSP